MALNYSKLEQNLTSYTQQHSEINWYPGVDISVHAWNQRQKLKRQMDEFCTFMFAGCDAWENFGAFIITDKRGDHKFYNGPSYTNKYSSPQFSSASGNLLGIDFKQQTISFKIGLYYFTTEDYQLFLDFLGAYKVDYLSFGFADKWSYLVKPSAISDSPRYVLESIPSYSAHNATESEESLILYTAIRLSETVSSIQYLNEGVGEWVDAPVMLRQEGKYYTTITYDDNRRWRIDGTEISSAEIESYCYHRLSNDNVIQINSVTVDGSAMVTYTTDSTLRLIILPGIAEGLSVVISYTYNHITEKKYFYYTELTLKFDVQGPACMQYNEEYHWTRSNLTSTTAIYQFNSTHLPDSLLDFPIIIDLPLYLNSTEPTIKAEIIYNSMSYTLFDIKFENLSFTNIGLIKLRFYNSQLQMYDEDSSQWVSASSIWSYQPTISLAQTQYYLWQPDIVNAKQPIVLEWISSGSSKEFYVYDPEQASYNGIGEDKNVLPYINNSTLNLHYDSESGLLFLMLGDSTLKLLSLTTSTVSGENLIKTLSTTKFQIPGAVRHQNIDNLTITFIFSGIQVDATDWSDPITCHARTNVI